ncbi:hypothetical protein [Ornithinibacillus sp. 179-J 7C1 HS]|uniref:hypothetical protein n=1 Tax=Ornithinibacillus sp. 179-J 7C1 HS TaxID=3142384 RepID=UPI00399FEA58
MEKKNRFIIIGLISICFVLITAFGFKQYKENQQFERYLSFTLVNDISILSSSTVMNSNYLEEIIEKEQITKEQLDYLQSNYVEIYRRGEKVVNLAEDWLKRKEDENHFANPYPVYMASYFGIYLRKLDEAELSNNNTFVLSSDQVEKFKLMKSVNDEWVRAILDNIEGMHSPTITELENGADIATDSYFQTYREEMINSEDWIEMIKQMQSSSKPHENEVEYFKDEK